MSGDEWERCQHGMRAKVCEWCDELAAVREERDAAQAALAQLRAVVSAQTGKPASFYVALALAHKQDSETVDEHEDYGEARTLKRERDEARALLRECAPFVEAHYPPNPDPRSIMARLAAALKGEDARD